MNQQVPPTTAHREDAQIYINLVKFIFSIKIEAGISPNEQ
jgi:hypothetical protein